MQDQQLTSELLANQSGSALRLLSGVLDAPGSGIRNILAGRNPLTGLFDLDRRITGRGLAEQYGLGANKPGLDTGDVIGFLTDVFTDPLTYLTFGAAAANKAGKIAQAADLMPGAIRDVATGELMQGRRTLARTTTLGQRLEKATPLQKLQAETVAKKLGTTLEKEMGNTLSRDIAIDIPFLGRMAEFNVLSKPVLEALDQAGHTLRASPIGRLHAQLFTKGAQGTKSFPVQIAMEQATREADMAARKYAEEAAQARMDLGSIGLKDTNEYRRFVRGAAEMTNPMRPTEKFTRLEDAVQANLPDRLRTPENVTKATEIVRRVVKDPTEMRYSITEQYGVAPPRTPEEYAAFMHREATDPDKLRAARGKKRAIKTQDIYGSRSFKDVPGGSNTIEDIMNDKEVWDIMQQGYRERNLAAAPRKEDLKSLEQMGFGGPNDIVQKGSKEVEVQPYDRQDLARNQAKKMVNMGERDAEQISRAQMPPEKYQNFTPPAAVDKIVEKHFKWDEYDFEEYAQLKAQKAAGELDDNAESALQAYEDQRKVAADLANAVSVRPLELIEAKRPYYGNDPLLDQMGYIAHSHEKAAYAKQMLQLGGLSAQRIIPGTGVFKFTEEFPGKMKPEGMTSLNEFIDNVIDPGFRKDAKAYRNDYGKSFAIRAIAPDLHKAGLIDKATLDNIIGDHAVYESNITSFRQAKDRQTRQEARRAKVEKQFESGKLSEAQYTAKMDEIESKIEAASAAQVHKYDGLMALNQIYVPDYIVEDMARIQGTLKDSNMMRGFLKYYDKALNVTKSNLTQPWPGFHVRNAYNMAWQMIVSGSYDPTYKRYDPRAYIKPLSDAAKLIRGETIEDAAKYFPAETLSNQQAMEKLRSIAFAHNTASGQHIFHSESNDVVGGFAEMTPDILKAMPGTVPEGKPGPMGMGYLAQGWKDLFTGKGGRNLFNVPGGREGKAFALQQGGAKASTYIESVGRTATMMARMKQGFDPDLAAMMSNAAHVDYCVDEATEILTQRGWLSVDELKVGDMALSIDPHSRDITWSAVTEVHRFKSRGYLYSCNNKRVDIACTGNHRWLAESSGARGGHWTKRAPKGVKTHMITTSELIETNKRLIMAGGTVSESPTVSPYSDEFVQLVAWSITEGHYPPDDRYGVRIAQSVTHNPDYVDEIRSLASHFVAGGCTASEYKVRHTKYGDILTWRFGAGIGELVKTAAPNKQITPQFLCQLTARQLELFYETLMKGDGMTIGRHDKSSRKRSVRVWSQKDRGRIDGFQMLCAMLGVRTRSRMKGDDSDCSVVTAYQTKHVYSQSMNWTVIPYDGDVWCPTTSTGTWMARRGGTTYWTGNSRLSNFEKQVMKRVVPFYTYARGMVPWQLKNLAEHPGGITAQTIRQFERAKGQGGFVPDYLQGSLAIPVGSEDKQGKQTFVTGFDLPFESINDYFRYGPDAMSTVGRTLREIGGQMSPALQLPAELAFNQSLYQGRNLKELDPALGRIAANLTGQDEPPFKTGLLDQLLMKSPASRYLATLKTLTDPRDPLVEQAIKKPLQLGTGVRFKDVNVEQQKDFAILEAIKDQAKGDRPFVTGEYVTVAKNKQSKLTDRQQRLLDLYRERSARLRKKQ